MTKNIKVQRRCPYCRRVTWQVRADDMGQGPCYVCDECCGMSKVDEEVDQ